MRGTVPSWLGGKVPLQPPTGRGWGLGHLRLSPADPQRQRCKPSGEGGDGTVPQASG